jgi:hypothetical protein
MANNSKLTVVAVVCIIVTACASGTGVYLRQKSNSSQPLIIAPTSTPPSEIVTQSPSPVLTSTGTPTAGTQTQAQTVLENFFASANAKDFEKAAALFGWSNPETGDINQWPGSTNAKTLENYCQAVGTCLKVKSAIGKKISGDEYQFTVSFLADNGETFALNPPAGVMASPTTSFIFKVKKINGVFKVVTPPLFRS